MSFISKSIADRQFLLNKSFYCVNTSYPMDNSLSGRRGPARRTSEKDVLCLHRLGRPSTVHSPDGVSYFLSRQSDVIASFSFGARSVQAEFLQSLKFAEFSVILWTICFLVIPK